MPSADGCRDLRSLSPWGLLKATYLKWSKDNGSRLAAAFSYYAIFSIGPLLIIAISLLSFFYGQRAAADQVRPQITSLVGDKAAGFIQDLIAKAHFSPSLSFAGLISAALILYAATNMFASLQDSLNLVFHVRVNPDRGWIGILKDRALTFIMVFAVGGFVLLSIGLTTAVAAATRGVADPGVVWWLREAAKFLISVLLFTGIFALMLKYLPDIRIDWRDTLIGAMVTAVLFSLARIGLGYYLGRTSMVGPFGAAGSLVVVMLFIYYSAQIFFIGAEFTQVWACRHGKAIAPAANARTIADPVAEKKQPQPKKDVEGRWMNLGDARGWRWASGAPEPLTQGEAGARATHGRRGSSRSFPGARGILRQASLAALVAIPAAWIYLRHRR